MIIFGSLNPFEINTFLTYLILSSSVEEVHILGAPNIWTSSTEEERIKYVRKVLISNGFNEPKIIKEFSEQALNIFNFLNKDPFYCLIATKE